jgi:hypothetical protein
MLVPILLGLLSTLAQNVAAADLIAFLQALPEGRKRRGCAIPSGCSWEALVNQVLSGRSEEGRCLWL